MSTTKEQWMSSCVVNAVLQHMEVLFKNFHRSHTETLSFMPDSIIDQYQEGLLSGVDMIYVAMRNDSCASEGRQLHHDFSSYLETSGDLTLAHFMLHYEMHGCEGKYLDRVIYSLNNVVAK